MNAQETIESVVADQLEPATRSKFRRDDVITKIDNDEIKDLKGLQKKAKKAPGRVKIAVARKEKDEVSDIEIEGVLAEALSADKKTGTMQVSDLGITVQNLTPEKAELLGVGDRRGVVVTDVGRVARNRFPAFSVGDTLNVHVRIIEAEKERIQVYQGVLIAENGRGVNRTITVRRIVANEGVERIFPLHSPRIAKIEVVRRGDARRAKLYYLRKRVGKSRRLRDQRRGLKHVQADKRPLAQVEEITEPDETADQET
jgi:large subunit ribosomal protein L19